MKPSSGHELDTFLKANGVSFYSSCQLVVRYDCLFLQVCMRMHIGPKSLFSHCFFLLILLAAVGLFDCFAMTLQQLSRMLPQNVTCLRYSHTI